MLSDYFTETIFLKTSMSVRRCHGLGGLPKHVT